MDPLLKLLSAIFYTEERHSRGVIICRACNSFIIDDVSNYIHDDSINSSIMIHGIQYYKREVIKHAMRHRSVNNCDGPDHRGDGKKRTYDTAGGYFYFVMYDGPNHYHDGPNHYHDSMSVESLSVLMTWVNIKEHMPQFLFVNCDYDLTLNFHEYLCEKHDITLLPEDPEITDEKENILSEECEAEVVKWDYECLYCDMEYESGLPSVEMVIDHLSCCKFLKHG